MSIAFGKGIEVGGGASAARHVAALENTVQAKARSFARRHIELVLLLDRRVLENIPCSTLHAKPHFTARG
jgi:hypothetical protein